MKTIRLLLPVAAVVSVVLPVVVFGPPQVDTRVARVEAGLLPPILWKGEKHAGMALADRLAHYQVPGVSLAVMHDGTLAWVRSWGVVRAGEPARVRPDTLFQAGSVSKTVAAMLTLRLASQGRIGLDDPVNTRLKSWHLSDSEAGGSQAVTIRHLLSHAAGLTPVTYQGLEPSAQIPTVLDLLLGKGQPASPPVARVEPPGRRFSYSNSAYVVLQQLLADVSGSPFDELARAELFGPLRMTSSSFASVPPAPLFDRAAWGHGERQRVITSKGLVVPAAVGGLWTIPSDLARLLVAFVRSYRGERDGPIRQTFAREAMQAQVGSQGLCALVEGTGDERRLIQMGAVPGFTAYLVAYPELGRGGVVMINAGGNSGALAQELVRAVAAEYEWPRYVREYERITLPSDAVMALAGDYLFDNPAYPRIHITVKDGRLLWGDRDMVAVVGGRFVVPSAGIEVEFLRDAAGAVVGAAYGSPGMRSVRLTRAKSKNL